LFRLPTTVHAYRHWSDIVPILKAVGVRKFLSCYLNWDELAIHLFDTTARTGGVFHFWGHSWEIDQHNDWARLERVLAHIGGREKAAYVTNGALAKEVEQQQKKSVLFVTPYFLPQGGGLEWYAFEIAQRLQANGWRVEVLTSGEKGSRDITEEYKGLTVHRLGYGLKLSNTPFSFRWFRRVRSVIEQVNPTLINVHMPVPGIGDVAIRAAGSRPVVLTYHAGTMLKGRMVPDFIIGLYERFILPRTIARADSLICSSEFVKNTIPARKAHTTVITPAVDETLCKPDDTIQAIPFEIVFICSFASMHRLKGLEVLREAVKLLTTQFPAISVKVIGEPGAKAIPRVRFIGRKSRAEVVREIQSGAVLILPSLAPAESFGMVLIEAMACKVPVIGSNAGGIPEVIEDGKDGLIVEAGNVSALAEAIARILSDRALAQRMGEAGYEKVLAKYTWDQKVHETENVFAQLT
jgi:rhamnosyl/mannosyltransferase